jgi:hypothetical protein
LNTVAIHETENTMDIINTDSTRTYNTRMSGEELKCVCIIEQILAQIYFTCHFYAYTSEIAEMNISVSPCVFIHPNVTT